MRRMMLRVLIITVALGAAAPVAMAQTAAQKKQAKQHFDEAKTLFNLGKFREAVAEFERSYRLFTAPEILFMIGQCYNQLGEPPRAAFYYRRYLDEKPNAKNKDEVEAMIADIEARSGRRPPPPGAVVTPPPPPPPPPKPVAKREPPPPPPKPIVAQVLPEPPAPAVAPLATMPTPPPPADEPSPFYKKWWFWGGVGAAVVTVVIISVAVSSGSGAPSGGLGTIDARGSGS
jgi:hypothetical protein